MRMLLIKRIVKSNWFLDSLFTLGWLAWRTSLAKKGYSQLGEDQVILRYLPEDYGNFLDVGAGHAVRGSNTFQLYRRGWDGLAIDPLKSHSKSFQIWRRRDKFLVAGLGSRSHSRDFFLPISL